MTKFLERIGAGIVLPLCLLMSFGCADYSPDIDNIHKRLDAMEAVSYTHLRAHET